MTMANDLGFDVLKKQKYLKLYHNDNSSVLTAIANDIGYDNILNQLKIHLIKMIKF